MPDPQDAKNELQRAEKSSEIVVDPLAWLTLPERYAYDYFLNVQGHGGSETYPLAPSVREGLFKLYLQGRTLNEIWATNRHLGFGQIVHGAVESRWVDLRTQYQSEIVNRAKARAVQAAAEGVEFTADMMAAIRAQHGPAISKFLQTGNVLDLGAGTSMTVIRQLKELAELLSKLTGQDQVKKVSGSIKHELSHTMVPTSPLPPIASGAATLGTWAAAETEKQLSEED